MKVHSGLAVLVVAAAAVFRLPLSSWMLLLLAITLVLTAELLNTAIEATIDLVSPEIHPLAKKAKDTAAGAVLLTAVFAVIAGIYVFLSSRDGLDHRCYVIISLQLQLV
ncbi:diacylglycerol kinase family protein [Paenibacillus rhizoplanae]